MFLTTLSYACRHDIPTAPYIRTRCANAAKDFVRAKGKEADLPFFVAGSMKRTEDDGRKLVFRNE